MPTVQEASGLFQTLPDKERQVVLSRGTERSFETGTQVHEQGGRSDDALIVLSGGLLRRHAGPKGVSVILGIDGPGSLAGATGLVTGRPHSAERLALTPTDTLALKAGDLRDLLTELPSFRWAVLTQMMRMHRAADHRLIAHMSQSVEGRLVEALLDLVAIPALVEDSSEPDGVELTATLSQADLAEWVGTSRESISRSLSTLRRNGCLDRQGRTMILFPHQLAARQAARH